MVGCYFLAVLSLIFIHRTLCDTRNRGALDLTEFMMAIYLIRGVLTGKLSSMPSALPAGLYQQVRVRTESQSRNPFGEPATPSQTHDQVVIQSPVQQQFIAQTHQHSYPNSTETALPSSLQTSLSPAVPAWQQAVPYDISPLVHAFANQLFDTMDTSQLGYIGPDVAAPFMMQSNLPAEILAAIW